MSQAEPRSFETALRLCALLMAWRRGGLLLHGAGLLKPASTAILALAPSEGGKSTLVDLADGFVSLSDETVFLGHESGSPFLGSTIFRSSAAKAPVSSAAPLSAILILEKSPAASFSRASASSATRVLVEQAYRPPSELADLREILRRSARFAEMIPAFHFRFPKGPEASVLLARVLDDLAKENP